MKHEDTDTHFVIPQALNPTIKQANIGPKMSYDIVQAKGTQEQVS